MVHKMKLVSFAFQLIKNGEKDVEVRLNDDKRQLIKIGDIIEFVNVDNGELLKVKVVNLYLFNSFDDLFNYFKHERLGLNEDDTAEIMNKFYTLEEQKKYKALGIQIKLV